ncbi:hypothetical protein AB0H76_15100 [Nocardia sp. NPDC050712]|uniref:hypothetical protein n=1 Tax=Nocardia sp. NPDC050712 TaxID=3155518 RepID=UPI0033C90820
MSELFLSDGFSRLRLARDPDGSVRLTIGDEGETGCTFTAGRHNTAEIIAFLRPARLFPTRPDHYRRDQFDPRDEVL